VNVNTEPEDPVQIQAEYDDAIEYHPTTRVGCRAPHVWLEKDLSTLDLFGRGYVLVTSRLEKNNDLIEVARQLQIPLRIFHLLQPAAQKIYEKRYVLVRPDGYVAWRGDALPGNLLGWLKTISGNGIGKN
jgi:hypothetical protein